MPKCKGCGFEIDPRDDECGYFTLADGSVYCEKCYANKRYKEIKDKTMWFESVKATIESLNKDLREAQDDTERKAIKKQIRVWMRKTPTPWEKLLRNNEYRTKVKEKWRNMGWKPYLSEEMEA